MLRSKCLVFCALVAIAFTYCTSEDVVQISPNTSINTIPSDLPFDLKGDRLGMSLADFKRKYARSVRGSNEGQPWCSDTRPGQLNSSLLSEPYMQSVGLINCRINFPFEEIRGDPPPTVANVPTQILVFHFVDGSLYRITVWFSHGGFAQVRAAMSEKYGPPSFSKMDTYQNRLGTKFDGESLLWKNEVSSAVLAERFGDLDTSTLIFVHKELNQKAEERRPKPRPDM